MSSSDKTFDGEVSQNISTLVKTFEQSQNNFDATQTIGFSPKDTLSPVFDENIILDNFGDIGKIQRDDIIREKETRIIYSGQQYYPERTVLIKKNKTPRKNDTLALINEAMNLGQLTHPNVPPIYNLQQDENNHTEIIMRKIKGDTFQQIISKAPLKDEELREAIRIILQVCQAVSFAHSLGIIHRNIKPENIVIGEFNQIYLVNWETAVNLTKSTTNLSGIVGTPAYMAPEMLYGDPKKVSKATDVYLLGALLHHILTGEPRNQGQTIEESINALIEPKPYEYRSNIPSDLTALCEKACAKKPEDRIQNVSEFHDALEEYFLHFEVFKLIEKGKQRLEEYKGLWMEQAKKESVEIDYLLLHQLSTQAKFSFEQALEIWPESADARNSLLELIEIMIEQALQIKEYQRAILLSQDGFLLADKKSYWANKTAEIQQNWKQEEQAQEELLRFGHTHDPSETQKARFILQRVIISSLLLSDILFWGWKIFSGHLSITSKDLFYHVVISVIPIWIATAILYHQLKVNEFGRRSLRIILFAGLSLLFAHFGYWKFDIDIQAISILNGLALTMLLHNATPALKSGPTLAIICLIIAFIVLLFPNLSMLAFYGYPAIILWKLNQEWTNSSGVTP